MPETGALSAQADGNGTAPAHARHSHHPYSRRAMTENTDTAIQQVRDYLMQLQDTICSELERLDGAARFREDPWQRPDGGGGRTRVLREGGVFEQAGVGFSHVYGTNLPGT